MPDLVETKQIHTDHGALIGEAQYSDGVLHGQCKLWTPEQQLVELSHFENGQLHGSYKTWGIGHLNAILPEFHMY